MKFLPSLRQLLLLTIAGGTIAFDQFTKQLVIDHLRYGQTMSVWGDYFSLTYVRNPGAAFGLLAKWDSSIRIPFFIVMPFLALIVIGFVFRKMGDKDFKMATALALIVGGAFGNLIDRMTYGYVVDFLDFHWGYLGPHFPAFNVADVAICIGVFFLIIDIYKKEVQENKKQKQEATKNASGTV